MKNTGDVCDPADNLFQRMGLCGNEKKYHDPGGNSGSSSSGKMRGKFHYDYAAETGGFGAGETDAGEGAGAGAEL